MFYHARPLRFVEYGKVEPAPVDAIDHYFANAYRWLGQHCGFFPQIWLSRSRSEITGYCQTSDNDQILFGFERIRGFSVDYDLWCLLLNPLINTESIAAADHVVEESIRAIADDPQSQDHPFANAWHRAGGSIPKVLQSTLFVEHDQVVVPRLNLKAAKRIVCRNEFQRKTLRRMGFISDRIVIQRCQQNRR